MQQEFIVKKQSSKLLLIISILTSIYMLSGYTGELKNYLSLLSVTIWILVAFATNSQTFIKMFENKIGLILLWYLSAYLLLLLASAGSNSLKYFGVAIVNFWPLLMLLYYIKSGFSKDIKIIIRASLIFWVFICVYSIAFYIDNPSAARLLAADQTYYKDLIFVGGYGLAFGSVMLNSFLLDLLTNHYFKKNTHKIAVLMMIALLSYLVIMTESVITIIVNIIGIVSVLVINSYYNKHIYRALFVGALSILSLSLVLVYHFEIGIWIVSATNSINYDVILSRFNEIGYKVAYGFNSTNSSDLDLRISNTFDSVSLFLKSPLIGQGYKYGFNFIAGKELGIGAHSEWVDMLASIGLLGGIPFLALYYRTFKLERYYSKKRYSSAYFIVLIVLGLLNPFRTLHSQYAYLFLIPGIAYIFSKEVKEVNTLESERYIK